MKTLRKVGFFFELCKADQRTELLRLQRAAPHPDEPKILEYLEQGCPTGVAMIIEYDELSSPPRPLGEAVLKTDGHWVWPASLTYFVKMYHIDLPGEFTADIAANNWQIPDSARSESGIPEGHSEF